MSNNILIVGATRGLGTSIGAVYSTDPSNRVFGTSRSSTPGSDSTITWLKEVDVSQPDVGQKLASQLPASTKLSTVVIAAGYFGFETFDSPDWEKQVRMYTTSAIGPVFVVHHLVKAGFLHEGSKVILVSSESGSITLRHEKEGGGNYGHHASKAALNMVGKLLSLDLKPRGIAVGLVHPGFMRTEMTKSVGFDKYWDAGGGKYTVCRERCACCHDTDVSLAVTPDEAARSLVSFIDTFDISKTGEYWAPRGPGYVFLLFMKIDADRCSRDIGTAEDVLGKELPTPLQLPW